MSTLKAGLYWVHTRSPSPFRSCLSLLVCRYPSFQGRPFPLSQWSLAAPVCCSWQGLDRSLAAAAKAVKISWYKILLLQLLTARATARTKVFLPWHLPWHGLVWRRYCQWCILHITPYFQKNCKFPLYFLSIDVFWVNLRFFTHPILTMVHLRIVQYTYWTPLCLSLCLAFSLPVCYLWFCLSFCLSLSHSVYLSLYLLFSPSVVFSPCLSLCISLLSVLLSVILSVFLSLS